MKDNVFRTPDLPLPVLHNVVWRLRGEMHARDFLCAPIPGGLVIRAPDVLPGATSVVEALTPSAGKRYRFSLLAHCVTRGPRGRAERPVQSAPHALAWLGTRLRGYVVETCAATAGVPLPLGRGPARACPVRFLGIARVSDAATAIETWTHGVGRMRSFGFGLLMLSPIN